MPERLHSFLVLCYGESPYLADCLSSLAAQTEKSEIVLCTSTPNARIAAAAEAFGARLCVNEKHIGIADDWNFAAAQCDTPYYTLAHQDDLYYPDYVKKLLPRMHKSIISFCDYEELTDAGLRRSTAMLFIKRLLLFPYLFRHSLNSPAAKRSILSFGSAVCCPSVMYNQARLKGFAFDPAYAVSLDWDAWLRMTDMPGAFTYEKSVQMAHRIHRESETSRQIASDGRNREDARMMARIWPAPVAKLLSRAYAHSTDSNGTTAGQRP